MQDKKAEPGVCRRCFGFVWLAQWCGFRFECDPTPIDLLTEVECFYSKRATFGIARTRPGFYLEHRSMLNIQKKYKFVLAKHQCDSVQYSREVPDYWNEKKAASPDALNF